METVEQTAELAPGASKTAISHHYDVGNDFWQLWLDPTLTYSCAMWAQEDESLEQAQLRKLDYHAAQARAPGCERILDVGCGWGSMISRLVRTHRVGEVVGLTLSETQAQWIASLSLPSTRVRVENWWDHDPVTPYDGIISIGAFEHFARPDDSDEEKVRSYREFFTRCRTWVKPGGRLSLQTCAYGNMERQANPFINRIIFPESELPTLGDIVTACKGLFEIVQLRNDRRDYERTCRVWLKNLKSQRPTITARFGEELYERYERYLKLCVIGFYSGTGALLRMTFERIGK